MKIIILLVSILTTNSAIANWNIKEPSKEIPQKMSGLIFGKNFNLGKASWSKDALTIESKNKIGVWAESELIIFLKQKDDKKEWLVTPEKSDFNSPQVHMKFGRKGADFPGTLMFPGEFCMYLKLIEKTDTKAKFQIHISLPDYKKSYLIGSFEAVIEKR